MLKKLMRLFSLMLMGLLVIGSQAVEASTLPFHRVFVGEEDFSRLFKQARSERWELLPLGERTTRVGLALCGTPYQNFTLEIDDHVEAASVNFDGMDCWTFFEISLNVARMLSLPPSEQTPQTLLRLIENERYYKGQCTGSYLSRIHHLEDLFADNESRGLLTNMTGSLGGVQIQRVVREMTVGWKHYRYMVKNPGLRPQVAAMEARISGMKVLHIPKSRVPSVEGSLRNGDIIAITSKYDGGYTSHVGLAYRDQQGVLRFMHASRKHKKVLVDSRLSDYLNQFSSHAGMIVARPKELSGNDMLQVARNTGTEVVKP